MSERGTAPLELALGALLVLVPVVLLVLSFGPWMERRLFTLAAAAESARYLVVSGGDREGAGDLVARMAEAHHLDPSSVRVSFCLAGPASLVPGVACRDEGRLVRGGSAVSTVEVDVPGVVTPFGTVGSLATSSRHAEPVDVYRSLP